MKLDYSDSVKQIYHEKKTENKAGKKSCSMLVMPIFNVVWSLSIYLFVEQSTHSFMDSSKKDITLEAQRLEQKRNEEVHKIVQQLNLSQNEPTDKSLIQKVQEKITEDFETIKDNLDEIFVGLPLLLSPATNIILPLLIGIMAYFICCFCGQDECYGPFLLAAPIIISKKAFCWTLLKTINLLEKIPCEEEIKTHTELVEIIQNEPKDNLLFGILFLALPALLFIIAFIVGLVKLMKKQQNQTLLRIDEDGNWVYGGRSSNLKQKLDKGGET